MYVESALSFLFFCLTQFSVGTPCRESEFKGLRGTLNNIAKKAVNNELEIPLREIPPNFLSHYCEHKLTSIPFRKLMAL